MSSNNTKQIKGLQLLFLNIRNWLSQEEKSRINYPPDTEDVINIKDIIIPNEFKNSHPSLKKIATYTERYELNGMVDIAITVRQRMNLAGDTFVKELYVLKDGYIRYLILKQNGINEVPVRFEKWLHNKLINEREK